MAVAVSATIPVDELTPDSAPSQIVRQGHNVEIEVKSLIPLGDSSIPCFWAWGDDLDEFECTVSAHPKVTNVVQIEAVDGGALYRAEWDIDSPLVQCLTEADGMLLDAYGTADEWDLTILFESGADASTFQECCRSVGVVLDVRSVDTEYEESTSGAAISSAQREAIVTAYEDGYFEQPRETTQEELAEKLNITPAAVGSRLQRGFANLVEELVLNK